MPCKNKSKSCPKCGSFNVRHLFPFVGSGVVRPYGCDECQKCKYQFNLKKYEFPMKGKDGKCPCCGSEDIEKGIYAGGGPDGHCEEDVCRKCGKHFNSRAVYVE